LLSSLTSKKLSTRLFVGFTLFYVIFFVIVIISYLTLPDGFLRSKNDILDFELATTFCPHLLQLLGYNLISAILILFFNCLSYQSTRLGHIPSGYFMIGIVFILNAITLGTWSFTIGSAAPNLIGRLLRQFDLVHRSGFWEMSGLLLITCSSCELAYRRKNKQQKVHLLTLLSANEKVMVLIGFGLMLCGAIIESWSILSK